VIEMLDRVPWRRDPEGTAVRLLLAASLAVTGMAKLASGWDPRFVLGPALFSIVAVVELLAAGLLLSRSVAWVGAGAGLAIGVGGIVVGLASGGRPCGCAGALATPTPRSHLMPAGTMSALSAIVLSGAVTRRSLVDASPEG
jgi:hypothetical protein